jgi:hypothetical protein
LALLVTSMVTLLLSSLLGLLLCLLLCLWLGLLLVTWIVCDDYVDCFVEDLIDTSHLLAATFHVTSPHFPSDGHPLLLGDGRQALGFEKVDTASFCSKVRLETDKDKRCIWAKMQNLRIPLAGVSTKPIRILMCTLLTLSITFSRELGQSMAKQTNRRSVSG